MVWIFKGLNIGETKSDSRAKIDNKCLNIRRLLALIVKEGYNARKLVLT